MNYYVGQLLSLNGDAPGAAARLASVVLRVRLRRGGQVTAGYSFDRLVGRPDFPLRVWSLMWVALLDGLVSSILPVRSHLAANLMGG